MITASFLRVAGAQRLFQERWLAKARPSCFGMREGCDQQQRLAGCGDHPHTQVLEARSSRPASHLNGQTVFGRGDDKTRSFGALRTSWCPFTKFKTLPCGTLRRVQGGRHEDAACPVIRRFQTSQVVLLRSPLSCCPSIRVAKARSAHLVISLRASFPDENARGLSFKVYHVIEYYDSYLTMGRV
jgi:hypothetical protein